MIDSPQFGLLSDQTATPYLSYWEFMLLKQAFPQGSTILSSTSSLTGVLSLAVQKPDGTISIMVVNRQVNSSTTKGGTGLSATVAVNLQGINPTNITLQQIDSTTNTSTGPAMVTLPVSTTPQVSLGGYGSAVLTISTNGQITAGPVPITPVISTPTPTVTPGPTFTPTPQPASATPTPTPPTANGGTLVLYDNAVSSLFKDNIYSYSSKNPCDTSTYVSAPCSYAAAFQAYGAYEFVSKIGSLNPKKYKSLDFNINTGGQPISNFGVTLGTLNGGWINEIVLSSSNVTANPGNGWVHVSIPFSQLDPKNKLFGTIDLENALNKSIPLIHVDDVQFTGL